MSDPVWWSDAVLDRSRWGELVEPTLDRIANARDRDRYPHALLLIGPAGFGRELAAVEAAVMLTCDGAHRPWSVSSCADRVRRGRHPDVVAMRPEGKKNTIRIQPLRDEIVTVVNSRPYEGLRRVWILDGVEAGNLGAEAANAFLKTLEEPPEHAVFILLAANPSAVLPTIRSRCQQLTLPGSSSMAEKAPDGIPPELAVSALRETKLGAILVDVRAALRSALEGESRQLLRLPYLVTGDASSFEVVAGVATELAAEQQAGEQAEGLIRLAADLLATERRRRALNLSADRQLVSCLMRWFRAE